MHKRESLSTAIALECCVNLFSQMEIQKNVEGGGDGVFSTHNPWCEFAKQKGGNKFLEEQI